MTNPMQLMQIMQNPKHALESMFSGQIQNNPMFQRAQEMSKGKSPQEIEQVIRNLCQQRGVDYDSALQQFQTQTGMK